MLPSRTLILAPVCLLLAACSDPVDKAAKERIFSPEDPPKAVASASETLDAAALDSDPRLARRVLTMSAAETTERLGAHRMDANIQFTWKGNDRGVQLTERRELIAGQGGVSGDFHATLENSREQGLEVIRADGKVYARNRYQKFRQRLRDRGMAERAREDIAGVLRDVDTLFKHRVVLESRGTSDHQGRPAHRYALKLAENAALVSDRELPPPPASKQGMDRSTLNRMGFLNDRTPTALEGMIVVDAKTGAVLWAKVDGRVQVPAAESTPAAELKLHVDLALSNIGKSVTLAAPKEFLPDEDKPAGIADALDRFGIPRAGQTAADAGTTAAEPEDEEAP
ncbi:MAG: hypothetical protein M3Y59_02365 [Myxococcota bacterium]|nr:hypothetical protein [Myxococcota bacterium]